MIIDAHAHIFDQMKGRVGSGPVQPLERGKVRLGNGQIINLLPPTSSVLRFSPEMFLDYMDQAGVDRAVLLQGPFYGNMNEYVQDAVTHWPGRFIGAAYLDLWQDNAREEFLHVTGMGFHIIKLELSEATGLIGLHPDLNLDDSCLDWFWIEVSERELVVTLDLGPVGGKAYQTEALVNTLSKHPELRIVIAHLSQPPLRNPENHDLNNLWRDQILLAQYKNVYLDLASLPYHVIGREEYPYPSVCDRIRHAVDLVGAEKLLWGTDLPGLLSVATYPQLLSYVAWGCNFLSPEQHAGILGHNAMAAYERRN